MAERGTPLFRPVGPPADDDAPRPLIEKLRWFAALALGGLAATAGAVVLLRGLLLLG